jgi:hypothetical protein
MRQSVTRQVVDEYAASFAKNMPDDLKAAIEKKVAKMKEEFVKANPDLDPLGLSWGGR